MLFYLAALLTIYGKRVDMQDSILKESIVIFIFQGNRCLDCFNISQMFLAHFGDNDLWDGKSVYFAIVFINYALVRCFLGN